MTRHETGTSVAASGRAALQACQDRLILVTAQGLTLGPMACALWPKPCGLCPGPCVRRRVHGQGKVIGPKGAEPNHGCWPGPGPKTRAHGLGQSQGRGGEGREIKAYYNQLGPTTSTLLQPELQCSRQSWSTSAFVLCPMPRLWHLLHWFLP